MINYFNKKDIEKINEFNQVSGMEHRSKPFDMNNIDDLKEAFKFAVCEFLDYMEYWNTLSDLGERFDESLEYYDPSTWLGMTMEISERDELAMEAEHCLRDAERVFTRLEDRAKSKCRKILEIILNGDEKIQEAILGFSYKCDTSFVDRIFEEVIDLENHYNMEDAYNEFITFVTDLFHEL